AGREAGDFPFRPARGALTHETMVHSGPVAAPGPTAQMDTGVPRGISPIKTIGRRAVRSMFQNQKVIVVMPAYNAARTLLQTHAEVLAQGVVDLVIVVDDASKDETTALARTLPSTIVHTHEKNLGYGGNQKSCYRLALENGADIVVMVHPDYQYTPKL